MPHDLLSELGPTRPCDEVTADGGELALSLARAREAPCWAVEVDEIRPLSAAVIGADRELRAEPALGGPTAFVWVGAGGECAFPVSVVVSAPNDEVNP